MMSENASRKRWHLMCLRSDSAPLIAPIRALTGTLELYLEKLLQEQNAYFESNVITSEMALTLVRSIWQTIEHFIDTLITEIEISSEAWISFSYVETKTSLDALDPYFDALNIYFNACVRQNMPPVVTGISPQGVPPQIAHEIFQPIPDTIQKLKSLVGDSANKQFDKDIGLECL